MLRRTSSFLSFQPSLKYLQVNRSLAKKSMGLSRTTTARQPPQQASEAEELEAYVEVASELGYPLTAQQIADAAKARPRSNWLRPHRQNSSPQRTSILRSWTRPQVATP